jgi:hypothetical protein
VSEQDKSVPPPPTGEGRVVSVAKAQVGGAWIVTVVTQAGAKFRLHTVGGLTFKEAVAMVRGLSEKSKNDRAA